MWQSNRQDVLRVTCLVEPSRAKSAFATHLHSLRFLKQPATNNERLQSLDSPIQLFLAVADVTWKNQIQLSTSAPELRMHEQTDGCRWLARRAGQGTAARTSRLRLCNQRYAPFALVTFPPLVALSLCRWHRHAFLQLFFQACKLLKINRHLYAYVHQHYHHSLLNIKINFIF